MVEGEDDWRLERLNWITKAWLDTGLVLGIPKLIISCEGTWDSRLIFLSILSGLLSVLLSDHDRANGPWSADLWNGGVSDPFFWTEIETEMKDYDGVFYGGLGILKIHFCPDCDDGEMVLLG